MKKIKKLMVAALISVFAISIVGCNMVAKTDAAIKKSVVAKVNSDTISRGQLDSRMEPVVAQMKGQGVDVTTTEGKQTLAGQKKQMLDTIIMESIIIQKAKENKIMPTEAKLTEAINKKLEEIKKGFVDDKGVPDEAKYKTALVQAGFTDASLKDYIRIEEIKTVVSDFVTKGIAIDDVKVKAEYDKDPLVYSEKPNTIHVAHILLKTETEAIAVKARLVKEDFAKVAKEVSIEEAAKESGGDLGDVPFVNSGMDETFMKAAIALKVGTLSDPIKTQFGFHVIKSISKTDYPAQKFEVVKEKIKTDLLAVEKNTLLNSTLDKWKKASKIETAKYEKNL